MPYGEYAQCPCCKKTAYGREEIEQKFGYRNMGMEDIFLNPIAAAVVPHIVRQANHVKQSEKRL